jgi:hypothetical protein
MVEFERSIKIKAPGGGRHYKSFIMPINGFNKFFNFLPDTSDKYPSREIQIGQKQ